MFNEILKKLMTEKNISNYRLAKEIGVSNSTIANWLNGTAHPNNERLQKLSEYFAVPVDYLLGKTDIKEKPSLSEELTDEEYEMLRLWRAAPSDKRRSLALEILKED